MSAVCFQDTGLKLVDEHAVIDELMELFVKYELEDFGQS